jgi:hypothetical protein
MYYTSVLPQPMFKSSVAPRVVHRMQHVLLVRISHILTQSGPQRYFGPQEHIYVPPSFLSVCLFLLHIHILYMEHVEYPFLF